MLIIDLGALVIDIRLEVSSVTHRDTSFLSQIHGYFLVLVSLKLNSIKLLLKLLLAVLQGLNNCFLACDLSLQLIYFFRLTRDQLSLLSGLGTLFLHVLLVHHHEFFDLELESLHFLVLLRETIDLLLLLADQLLVLLGFLLTTLQVARERGDFLSLVLKQGKEFALQAGHLLLRPAGGIFLNPDFKLAHRPGYQAKLLLDVLEAH